MRAAFLYVALIVSLLSFAALAAQPAALPSAEDVLGAEHYRQALTASIMRSGKEAALLPAHPAALALRRSLAGGKAPLLVESLMLLRRELPDRRTAASVEQAQVATILSSFSSMKGIRYFSASEGKERVLFSASYRVALSVGGKAPAALPDPPSPDRGGRVDSRVYQEDSRFGGNFYRYGISAPEGAVLLEGANEGALKIGPFTALKAGDMKLHLLVIQASDALILYSATELGVSGLFRSKLEESFSNRAAALFSWFASQYGR